MSGYIAPFYLQQFRLPNGLPLVGGSITTYSNQTSIPKAIFYDITLQNACPNPLQLDSAGFAPEFYLGSGLYTFVIKDSLGNIIATRDNIAGSVSSVDLANISATSAAYQIKIDENDNNPGYIWNKLSATNTIDYINAGDKIAINVKNPWKVKANASDNNPGYISDKIGDTSSIRLSVSAEKLYAEYSGIQPVFENSTTISWATSGNAVSATVIDSGKVKIDSSDSLEYLQDKIQAGSGIVFTQTEDINGKQIHISTTNSTTNAGKVKVTSGDTLEYLAEKIVAGNGIIVSASNDKITISNKDQYYVSAISYTNALVISSTGDFAVAAVGVGAGVWDVTGNILGQYVDSLLGNINSSPIIEFDGYEQFVFSATSNPQGTMSMPMGTKRITLATPGTIYLMVTAQLQTYTSANIWGNVQARQVN